MKKFISIFMLIASMTNTNAQKKQATTKEIPYQLVTNYFVKNTFKKAKFTNPKITTQKEFDALFGAAAFMGDAGKPTRINFAKQYVIAVTTKETDYTFTLNPISLTKKGTKILFLTKFTPIEKTTASLKPLLLIAVDKKYTGKVETQIIQIDVIEDKTAGNLTLSSQWVLASFEGDSNPVSKNTYITINQDLNSITGNGGCNTIIGTVKVSGDTIEFSKMISTQMACDNLNQENRFNGLLYIANRYKINGGQLFLYQNDKLLMTLESYR